MDLGTTGANLAKALLFQLCGVRGRGFTEAGAAERGYASLPLGTGKCAPARVCHVDKTWRVPSEH